ncbi:helix-turn-helix protein [compost metagenome]
MPEDNTTCMEYSARAYTLSIAESTTLRSISGMSTWYEKAKARMRELNLTQEQMAERLGFSPGAIGHWLNGRREPKLDVINRFLAELDLPELALPNGSSPESINEKKAAEPGELVPGPPIYEAFKRVQIRGISQLGPDGYWDEELTAEGWIDIPTTDPDAYALRAKGESMAPAIRSGWAVWCEPNHRLVPGEYVMVCRTDGQRMIKELLFENAESVSLMSVNDNFGRLTIPRDEIETIHYVGGIVPASKIRF